MGRANRAQTGSDSPAELMPEIPLGELKKLDQLDRISVIEAHNYMRANQNPRPIVEPFPDVEAAESATSSAREGE